MGLLWLLVIEGCLWVNYMSKSPMSESSECLEFELLEAWIALGSLRCNLMAYALDEADVQIPPEPYW